MNQKTTANHPIYRIALATGLLFLGSLPLSGQVFGEDWQEFVSKEGAFRIMSPGILTEKNDTVPTPVGDLIYHTFFHQQPGEREGNLVYMISYCDYPEGALHSDSIDLLKEFFDATVAAAASSVAGELTYQAKEELQGFPGRRWRIDYMGGKSTIRTLAFVARNRYYALQTVAYLQRNTNVDTDSFFKSFQLLPVK